jgi:hypothetical protein
MTRESFETVYTTNSDVSPNRVSYRGRAMCSLADNLESARDDIERNNADEHVSLRCAITHEKDFGAISIFAEIEMEDRRAMRVFEDFTNHGFVPMTMEGKTAKLKKEREL